MFRATTENIKTDTWLGNILDKESFRVSITDEFITKTFLSEDALEKQWLTYIKQENVFVFSKVATTALQHIAFLENKGFHLIDTNVTLLNNKPTLQTIQNKANVQYDFAKPNDAKQLGKVAYHAFHYTRFHLDANVTNHQANVIKRDWATNFFKGKRGDFMVVARCEGQVAGFLQLLLHKEQLVIDLIAVDSKHRRKGIAKNMIQFAINNIPNITTVLVGTQIANVPSINLYQKMGFFFHNAKYVFHYHNSQKIAYENR